MFYKKTLIPLNSIWPIGVQIQLDQCLIKLISLLILHDMISL